MNELNRYGTTIMCPKGTSGAGMISLEMGKVDDAEARIPDVARANPETAPFLLSIYNDAYLDLRRMLSTLKLEHTYAMRVAQKRKALVILDVAPKVLQEKGLTTSKNPAGSADLREAVLDADEEYQRAMDRVDMIAAVHSLLDGKAKAIEMAYTAVKRIIDRNQGPLGTVNLSMGNQLDGKEAGQEIDVTPRIGKARY